MPKKHVADFFDSYADRFHSIYGDKNTWMNSMINKLFRRSMKIRYIKTIQGCRPIQEKSVIDIGCGPGLYAITLARNGAKHVCGIDFSKEMVDLAKKNAALSGLDQKCEFILADFTKYPLEKKFDYTVIMGFMDYVKYPRTVVEKALSLTKSKAFFSFPAAGGFLAWQRRLRYAAKCDLFMYDREMLYKLFESVNCKKFEIEKISRDYFVAAYLE